VKGGNKKNREQNAIEEKIFSFTPWGKEGSRYLTGAIEGVSVEWAGRK